MSQELDFSRNVYLDRDEQGVVRGLLHFTEPFESAAATRQLVAADYLESFSDLLGLEAAELAQWRRASRCPLLPHEMSASCAWRCPRVGGVKLLALPSRADPEADGGGASGSASASVGCRSGGLEAR
jgi:hypothetical protein